MDRRSRLPALTLVVGLLVGAGALGAARAGSTSSARSWNESVTAPAQFDLSLAEVRFGPPLPAAPPVGARSRAASSIGVALRGSTGLDYVAAAVTRFGVHGRPRALVLVVNRRPRGSLAPDLARIELSLTAARWLGHPLLSQISDPFTRASPGLTPALCDLPIRGASLKATDVRAVLSRGVPLAGLQAGDAVAQAYDVVCALPYASSFKAAVGESCPSGSGSGAAPLGALCCPANAICAPAPIPPAPAPEPPRCAPCVPPPGYACPLAAGPSVCIGPVTGRARRLAGGAH